ncbi:protein-L-isoaspartate(D-aspartate) O-methyltransferase [Raineyella antarctica]|uniref:Protein-L-isoaspartate O-methyltransferase n=1 Tax=Raineyella antarctica TaxID=1577474 RepID=A0A1G6GE30_9ACTN|nr:methyltransferase domain-containing protein [Raineyella antarctica]SDB80005.1 protein-L-isoaspartate(D-aspartate) O-methyltransferase [Raineyella antarctica]
MADQAAGAATAAEILLVMRELGRRPFLPADQRPYAGVDAPLPIGHGQTNSQPSTVLNMLELLEVEPGASVLDVGCGSGWTTAILARLVGETGRVLGVERIPELTRRARKAVEDQHLPWAQVRQAIPGVLGLPDEGPYDRILVSAQADTMPTELVDQLAPGGVMVVPVGWLMHRVRKDATGAVRDTTHGEYSFVPLIT